MTQAELENKRLFHSFIAGANEVILKKDELNRINVFPIADGDTGSNLASLMQAIIDNVTHEQKTTHQLLDNISEAALIGARGNSGIIFAQYLSAIAENFSELEANYFNFVASLQTAVKKAYDALLDPQEGTILSVMSAWSDNLVTSFNQGESFKEALLKAHASAEEALSQTEFQLAVLKKNQLVDSGAKGFYYFISGFTNSYCGEYVGENFTTENLNSVKLIKHDHVAIDEPTFRYCSEFIIKESSVEKNDLETALSTKGDSLVIASNKNSQKIHIHTNQPQEVLSLLESFGTISYQKVDDMLLQYHVNKSRRSRIAIVTDSIADLSPDFILKHQIHVLPMNILSEDNTFLDKLTIDSAGLEKKLNKQMKMSTAQPSIQSVDALLSFLQDKYEQVIVISVASKLSGTYQLIQQRIKEKKLSKDWISVIDSKLNSVAQGLLVKETTYLVESGLSFNEVVKQIEQMVKQTFIYVAVADLNPMIESGRIPTVLGKLAKKLSLYPIVSLDQLGDGKLMGISFSQKQSMKKITNLISKQKTGELSVTHVCDEKNAQLFVNQLEKKSLKVSDVVDSSAAIAISAGLGSVAVAGIIKGEK